MKSGILIWSVLILICVQYLYPQVTGPWDNVSSFTKTRKFYKRVEWFYKQRTAPYDTISFDRINDELEREKATSKKASYKDINPWLPIGPKGIISYFPSHWGVCSGRCRGLDIHPADPNIVYIGAASGGIWKTTNGGANWKCLSEDLPSNTFGAIAIDPVNPQTVYAGTGESVYGLATTIYYGNGMFKTTDGGETWTKIAPELGNYSHFGDVVVNHHNHNIIYAGLNSSNYFLGSLQNTGLWMSTDAGASWTRTLNARYVFDVEVHPTDPNIVYAGIGGGAEPAGFYISYDKGVTWNKSTGGFPSAGQVGRIQISVCKSNPLFIYAIVFNPTVTTAWKSSDGGLNWSQFNCANPLGGYHVTMDWYDQGSYDLCIAVKPDNPNFVLAGNVELHRSTDGNTMSVFRINNGGDVWSSPVHCDYHRIVYSSSNPEIVYMISDGGVSKSTDGGNTWFDRNNDISTIQFYSIASHPTDRRKVIGGSQDNGNFLTDDGGTTNWEMTTTGDGMNCFFDYVNPNIVYFSIQYGDIYKSMQGGAYNTNNRISPPYSSGESAYWTAPFFMHPTDHNTIYVASNRLWKSTNGGGNWSVVSPTFSQTITSMEQNAVFPDVMILSASSTFSANPSVHVSTDGGAQWTNVTSNIPGPGRFISTVKTDPLKRNTVYVLKTGFGTGKLYRSDDLGASWTNLSGNLPDLPCNDLFIDPSIPGNLYVANDFGVYRTTDGGINWVRLNIGMPVIPVMDLDFVQYGATRLLRAGTYGRSAYEMELPDANAAQLNLISPFGGEKVVQGSSVKLRWSYNLISRINILFSKDNKRTWETLVSDFPADSIQHTWQIPLIISDSCYINLINSDNPQMSQMNGLPFSIIELQAPKLISPANGIAGYENEPVKLEWGSNSGISCYTLQVANDSLFTRIAYSDSLLTTTSASVNGLLNNTKYFWRVGGRNELVTNRFSDFWSFKTMLAKPVLAFPPNNSANITTEVMLKWDTVSGAERYHLQVAKTAWFGSFTANDSLLSTTSYQLRGLENSRTYYWKVKAINSGGSGKFSASNKFQTEAPTSVTGNEARIPDKNEISNNYPNPFNPETFINYQLAANTRVVMKLYDILGNELAVLLNDEQEAGVHHLRLSIDDYRLSSGVYICTMNAGSYSGSIKITVLK